MTTTELPSLVKHKKDEVLSKAMHLLDKHGIPEWEVKVTRRVKESGLCTSNTKTISISVYQAEGDLEDTILHEIAHALVGPKHKHGPAWIEKAREIGARPEACSKAKLGPGVGYKYTCSKCGGMCGNSVGRLKNLNSRYTLCCNAAVIIERN